MNWLRRLLHRTEPTLSDAQPRDASFLAALHGASFRRGWTEQEFERLLLDRNIVTHCARTGARIVGFIMSRIVAGEAEILSVAIASAQRGGGLAGRLLMFHLRRLAGLGTRTVFLEVDRDNIPACRLYTRAHFHEVGQRAGYYPRQSGQASTALILRRDLA